MSSLKQIPVACCLSDAEFRQREAGLLARFRASVVAIDELDEGYVVRLPGDGDAIRLVAEVMMAERQCCPFLHFTLIAEPGMGPLRISITGPAGTKEFLQQLLVN